MGQSFKNEIQVMKEILVKKNAEMQSIMQKQRDLHGKQVT